MAGGVKGDCKMLNEGKPDIVISFPVGRGTENMIRISLAAGVPVFFEVS